MLYSVFPIFSKIVDSDGIGFRFDNVEKLASHLDKLAGIYFALKD